MRRARPGEGTRGHLPPELGAPVGIRGHLGNVNKGTRTVRVFVAASNVWTREGWPYVELEVHLTDLSEWLH